MTPFFYKLLHLSALGFMAFLLGDSLKNKDKNKSLSARWHFFIISFLAALGGFGLMKWRDIYTYAIWTWPHWVATKVFLFFLLCALPWMARKGLPAPLAWILFALIWTGAVWLGESNSLFLHAARPLEFFAP